MNRILVAMPAYNESKVISSTINAIKKEGFEHILVVDDCSTDDTYLQSKETGVNVISLPINRGAGGATNTIITYAKRNDFDTLVLIDSDGQHEPKEIKKLLKELDTTQYDIVIGSRTIENNSTMPLLKKIANLIGSLLTWVFFRVFVWDSQSGFKALNRKAIENITLTFDRYEFSSEILGECHKHNLRIKEIPIKTIYTVHSMSKGHGQNIFNGFSMLFRFLIKHKK